MKREAVAVIGPGRVGGALGRLLARAGYRVVAVAGRTRRSAASAARFIGAGMPTADPAAAAARATIVLLTVPDREIRGVCERIARGGGFRRGVLVAHASGAHTRELLDAARAAGALRAVLHPLQAVPSRALGVANIPGSFFRTEADRGARSRVRALVGALGGTELSLPGWAGDPASAALYHAGAVAASNYLVTLLDYAARLLRTLGADRRQALRAVLPLVRGTLANIERLGIPAALTGPVARGDVATVAAHVAALQGRAPELLPLYALLARETVSLAREKGGLSEAAAADLLRIVRPPVPGARPAPALGSPAAAATSGRDGAARHARPRSACASPGRARGRRA